MSTPQEEFVLNKQRLVLAEANTQYILDRYDNEEYHQMTWAHRIECEKCGSESTVHADVPKGISLDKAFCPKCERPAKLIPFVEIVKFDEGEAWNEQN